MNDDGVWLDCLEVYLVLVQCHTHPLLAKRPLNYLSM